jgi:hypothetical protein
MNALSGTGQRCHSLAVCLSTYTRLFDAVTERIDPKQAIREARYRVDANARRAAG